jgi:hypothetical protein
MPHLAANTGFVQVMVATIFVVAGCGSGTGTENEATDLASSLNTTLARELPRMDQYTKRYLAKQGIAATGHSRLVPEKTTCWSADVPDHYPFECWAVIELAGPVNGPQSTAFVVTQFDGKCWKATEWGWNNNGEIPEPGAGAAPQVDGPFDLGSAPASKQLSGCLGQTAGTDG